MLAITTLLCFVVAHESWASNHLRHLTTLQKMHPTWSFELVSVESMIKEAVGSLKTVDPKLTEDTLRAKINASLGPETTHIVRKVGDPKWSKNPPASFDTRKEWKGCAQLINGIDEEGCCSDGPSVAASVATDRYCIYTNETFKERLSAQMLIGCAQPCTVNKYISDSFAYIVKYGIPTGGHYESKQGCVPYEMEACRHSNTSYVGDVTDETRKSGSAVRKLKPCEEYFVYDRDCPKKCPNRKYPKSLQEDLKHFTAYYTLRDSEYHIRDEMMAYGPVATSIALFNDFFRYPANGMYILEKHPKFIAWDKFLKLIGWGEENGRKYWIALNTWDNWGPTKEFKIPRGENHAAVEFILYAGVYNDIH